MIFSEAQEGRKMGKMRQSYHLEPDRGLLNDPNGLAWFNGKYYVFFQWNRFAKDHSYKEWGLFTSSDLLHWKFEGSALLPDQPYDKDGVYSGSGCVIGDALHLYYTGNTKTNGVRKVHQCMAVTKDGRKYLKYGSVLETPEGYTQHFRDPKVVKRNGQKYFMLVGAQRQCGKGAVTLAESKDGLRWSFKGNLGVTEKYEMVECPDLFSLDGHDILMFNPQQRDNEKDTCGTSFSVYKVAQFDEESGTIADPDLDTCIRIDQGFDFYAPQTFCDGKGRRLLFAWMSRMEADGEQIFSEGERSIHCLTLPRELHIRNGKLYQNVPEEYDRLKGGKISLHEFTAVFPSRTAYIRLSGGDLTRNMSVRFPEDGTQIAYDGGNHSFILRRYNWITQQPEEKRFTLESLDTIEIWLDQSSAEIFLNGGEYVLTSRIYPRTQRQTAVFEGLSETVAVECREINPAG